MTKKQLFHVGGMACAACAAHVQQAVAALNGVSDANVNLLAKEMTVAFDPDQVTPDQIRKAVTGLGFTIDDPAPAADPFAEDKKECAALKWRFIFSLIFLLPLTWIAMGSMLGLPQLTALKESPTAAALLQFFLLVPILLLNRRFFINGFMRLAKFKPNMDSLIATGAGAGVIYSFIICGKILVDNTPELLHELYFEAAGMILVIVTLGKYLEMRSRGKTGDAIVKLMALKPETAAVERDGKEIEIPVSDIRSGETVLLREGSAVPVDGTILEGNGSFDQSAITGESLPVERSAGTTVVSGSICCGGFVRFRADRIGEDTTLARIISMVREASGSKAPVARLADKVSAVFVPVVMTIALATFIFWLAAGAGAGAALESAIAVLVISCPCALGLATPVAIMTGTGRGAELGILFKNAEALERLQSIRTAVFDKTGTLTTGKPVVTDVICAEGVQEADLIRLAAGLEHFSDHPHAKAICRYAAEKNISPAPVNGFKSNPGMGVCGTNEDGGTIGGGNTAMLQELAVKEDETMTRQAEILADNGKTPIRFFRNETVAGLIAVADTLRSGSTAAIQSFQQMKIHTILLTGDNRRTADAIARELRIDDVRAEVLPADKETVIRSLTDKNNAVAMIGDGINDAPALARATVGIAIGAGTDVAVEAADVVLAQSDPRAAAEAVELSRAVIRNIRMNLFWALIYNIIGIPFAAGVFYHWLDWRLPPMFGALAMSLSSVCVVTNALRLRNFHRKK